MAERIKKNTYFISFGLITQMLLSFALVPFSTRYLGAEGYGKYGLAGTLMFFVFLFNDLGLNTYVTREVARKRDEAEKFLSYTFTLKIILAPVNFILLFIFLFISGYDKDTQIVILLFAAYGILTSYVKLGFGVFEALERMEYEMLVLIVEKVLVTSIGIFVLVTHRGLYLFCTVFVLSGLLSLALTLWMIRKKFAKLHFRFDTKYMWTMVKGALPLGYSMIIAMIYNYVGILMLSFLKSPEVLGWYLLAFRLLTITNTFPNILVTSMFPALSRAYVNSAEQFQEWFTKGFKYLSYLALPLIAGTMLLAPQIIHLISGADYANSVPVLKIMAWTSGILFYNIYFTGIFKAANKQKPLVYIQIASLFINIIINYILIRQYSYIGAAWATLATESVIFAANFIYIHLKVTRLRELSYLFKSLVSTILMIGFILLQHWNVVLIVAISSTIYFTSLYLLKGFTFKEILLLRKES